MKKVLLSGAAAAVLVVACGAAALAQGRDAEAAERRKNIRYMEDVLARAVRLGAEEFGRELERYDPAGVTVLMGTPRARGFPIDGHGIFFDVEVPDINQSVVWSVMMTQRDRRVGDALASLTSALGAMPEGAPRAQAQSALQHLSSTVGPSRSQTGTRPDGAEAPPPGRVGAANAPMMDPRKQYQDAVIGSLIEAMLGYSVQMALGPDEWLTVAARGNDAPLGPQQGLADPVTITVKVKGGDLAIYHADPARRSEIREKVRADARVF